MAEMGPAKRPMVCSRDRGHQGAHQEIEATTASGVLCGEWLGWEDLTQKHKLAAQEATIADLRAEVEKRAAAMRILRDAMLEACKTFDQIAPTLEKAGWIPAPAVNGRRALRYALRDAEVLAPETDQGES